MSGSSEQQPKLLIKSRPYPPGMVSGKGDKSRGQSLGKSPGKRTPNATTMPYVSGTASTQVPGSTLNVEKTSIAGSASKADKTLPAAENTTSKVVNRSTTNEQSKLVLRSVELQKMLATMVLKYVESGTATLDTTKTPILELSEKTILRCRQKECPIIIPRFLYLHHERALKGRTVEELVVMAEIRLIRELMKHYNTHAEESKNEESHRADELIRKLMKKKPETLWSYKFGNCAKKMREEEQKKVAELKRMLLKDPTTILYSDEINKLLTVEVGMKQKK